MSIRIWVALAALFTTLAVVAAAGAQAFEGEGKTFMAVFAVMFVAIAIFSLWSYIDLQRRKRSIR